VIVLGPVSYGDGIRALSNHSIKAWLLIRMVIVTILKTNGQKGRAKDFLGLTGKNAPDLSSLIIYYIW
jgi:hypothetical protein